MSFTKIALAAAVFTITTAANADITQGLVGSWNFDDCTANDSSGNENNGVIQGNPICVAGHSGNSFSFNGSTDYISIPDEQSNFASSDLTISVWIKPKSSQQDFSGIIDKSHTANNISGWVLQKSNIGSGLSFYFTYCDQSILTCSQATGEVQKITIKPDKWNHLVITKSGSTVTNYLNSKKVSTQTYPFGTYTKTSYPLFIGAVNGQTRYFNGSIDEVRIYNRALTATDAQTLYYQNNPPTIKGTAPWVTPHVVTCENLTQGLTVSIPQAKTGGWDCENSGLSVKSGDKVKVTIEGTRF